VAKAPTPAPPPTAQHEGFAASAPPVAELAAQPEGFAAPEPGKVSPFLWMLRVDQGVRGLGGDVARRWAEKPLTAADADNPDAAAKSVGARAENELRVAAGAYRPHVPPGARAAYDRSTDEVAAAVNKQTSDTVRARARAAHEDNARATFEATREHLVAAHDQAVRAGDHPRAETLAAQIADLDRFHRAYLRADTATKTAAPAPTDEPKAQPASSDPAPTPASTEPEKKDTPALGHDPGALMPGESPVIPTRTEPPATPPADPSIPPRPPGAPMTEEERQALDRKMADEAMELRKAHRRGEIESLPDGLVDLALRYGHLPGWLADELRIRMMSTDNGTSLEQRAESARAIVRLAEAMPEAFAGEFADLPNVLLFAKTYLAAYERPEFATNPGATLAQALKDADLSDLGSALALAAVFGIMGAKGGRSRRATSGLIANRRGKTTREIHDEHRKAFDRLGSEKGTYRFFENRETVRVNGVRIEADKGAVIDKSVLASGVPKGFENMHSFRSHMERLRSAVPESYGRTVVGLRGSALHGRKSEISQVTGERNNTGPKFDARGPGTSDWDLFVVNKGLHAAIVRKGIDPRSLTPKQLYDLGYTSLADGLRSLTGRRANTSLRVYPNFDALSGKHRGVDGQGNRSFLLLE
jgi:hypothetical protein